jgi:hypothetical protein
MNDQSRCQSAAFFWLRKSACRIEKVSPCNGTGHICEMWLFAEDQAAEDAFWGWKISFTRRAASHLGTVLHLRDVSERVRGGVERCIRAVSGPLQEMKC